MISAFLVFSACKPPVILLPGLYGSALTASYEDGFRQHWYCPKEMSDELFWVKYQMVIPPVYNCVFEMVRGYYDPDAKRIRSPPGLKVGVPDFGGDEGIEYVDEEGIFGLHFLESFAAMLKYLKGKGYVVKQDLFGAPYDWVLAMNGLAPEFFPQLKELVETAYNKNNGQKVTVLGYSLGGMVTQRFFGHYCTKDWKEKYIAKVILLAPAFGGASMTLDIAWNRYFPFFPQLKSEILEMTIETIPVIHALFPNIHVYGDEALVKGPNGEVITAEGIPQFLIDHGKIRKENIDLMMEGIKTTFEVPQDPDVPVMMLYNSAYNTDYGLEFKNGYDNQSTTFKAPGDGTVPAIGPQWGCNNWSGNKALVCYDVKQSSGFDHGEMSTNEYCLDTIYNYIVSDEWVNVKGARFVTAPLVEMSDDLSSYRITGTRDEQVEFIKKT